MRAPLVTVVMLLLLSACSSSTKAPTTPASELQAAARRTLDSDSYRARAAVRHDDNVTRYTIEWARPNVRNSDERGEALVVDNIAYQPDPETEDGFNAERMPNGDVCRALLDTSVVVLRALEANGSKVTRKSEAVFAYSFRAKTKERATGEATIGDGRIRRLTVKTRDFAMTFTYEYEDVPRITAPPAERVVPAPTSGPTCPPEGEPPPEAGVCIQDAGTPPAFP